MQSIIRFFFNIWNAQELAGFEKFWRMTALEHAETIGRLESENAALRQQASKRDSSGRFAPKNTGQ